MKEQQTNVRNQARRPVSIRCNSGDYCHIDALQVVQLPTVELEDNSKWKKLLRAGVLSIVDSAKEKKKPASSARAKKSSKLVPAITGKSKQG